MKIFRKRYQGFLRIATVGVGVILQALFLFLASLLLQQYFSWFYILVEVIAICAAFSLVYNEESYKESWIIIILVLPVFGFFLYFMWGRNRRNSRQYKRTREVWEKSREFLYQDSKVIEKFHDRHPNKSQISRRLINDGYMLYDHTKVTYYEVGEKKLDALCEDLEKAEKFIFLEYFIINDGEIWRRIKDILARKVQEHVEVRLLYDDFGCLYLNNIEFRQELAKLGIRFSVFAPLHKGSTRLTFNYRNHQKIAIIDGNIGYTGGINLSDEYANIIERFGHWKDTAIRLEGEGVWGLTMIFLQMWEASKEYDNLDYKKYTPTLKLGSDIQTLDLTEDRVAEVLKDSEAAGQAEENKTTEKIETFSDVGIVQPMADGPANNPNNPIWDTYMNMIGKAKDYIYFTTPYLVLEQEMVHELCRAAKSGVDVRIITPRQYDKWYVYMATVKNYGKLLAGGVKIYEYLPGFIHSKTVVSDDDCAVCGSINMDYRSFFLHYECGVFMSDVQAVMDIKTDIIETMKKCEEITLDKWKHRPLWQKVVQTGILLFSPIL
jgi:cardiolipin synthase